MQPIQTALTEHAKIAYPIIGGAMYPCSNPEIVAAVSEAGGIGVLQPLSLTFVYKYEFREGMRKIKSLTSKPVGMNVLTERSSKKYLERMSQWLDVALEEGVRFFVTSLGNPKWIVDRVRPRGGIVYHDVTELKWGQKARDAGVDGLIAVNNRAGGHAGAKDPRLLHDELAVLGLPLVCAGGIGAPQDFVSAMHMGYAGVQMGTRLIATTECAAHPDYKNAIVAAKESDIVLTDKISGVPVSVILTPYVKKVGVKAGWLARQLLKHPRTKHLMRLYYTVASLFKLKNSTLKGNSYLNYYQAGKSVRGVDSILPAKTVIDQCVAEWRKR